MVLSIFCLFLSASAFKVHVPSSPLVAVRGNYAVLGCSFPPVQQSGTPTNLLVTWQRGESAKVVHSFYYGQNQLARQSIEFKNRTELYISELGAGNASLRLSDIREEDAGRYLCTVSDSRGTDKAEINLEYTAFYSEPLLNIEVGPHNTSIQFETQGFPKAKVQWLGPEEEQLEHQSDFTLRDGLFNLRTSYVVKSNKAPINITFQLTNQPLKQVLVRRVCLNHGETPISGVFKSTIVLSCFCVFLVVAVGGLIFYIWRNRRKQSETNAPSRLGDIKSSTPHQRENGNGLI